MITHSARETRQQKDQGRIGKNLKRGRGGRNPLSTMTDIKLVTTKARKNYLVSEPNYLIIKCFPGNLLAIEMKVRNNYS